MTNGEKYKTVEERTEAFDRFCHAQTACGVCKLRGTEDYVNKTLCAFRWLNTNDTRRCEMSAEGIVTMEITKDARMKPLDGETTFQFGKDSLAVRDGRFITDADFNSICRERGIAEGDAARFTDFFDLLLVEPVIWGGEHGYMIYG